MISSKHSPSKPGIRQQYTNNSSGDRGTTSSASALSSRLAYKCSKFYLPGTGLLSFVPPPRVTCAPPPQTEQPRVVDDWKTELDGANEAYVPREGKNLAIFKTCCWPHDAMDDKQAEWLLRKSLRVAMTLDMAPIFELSGRFYRLCNLDVFCPGTTESMIGVLVENEAGHNEKWKLAQIYGPTQVQQQFNVCQGLLPRSPRCWLVERALRECNGWLTPVQLDAECAHRVVERINWKKMIHRTESKAANTRRDLWRLSKGHEFWRRLTAIIKQRLLSGHGDLVLGIIANPKKSALLEWRRFITVGEHQIAIGLRWLQQERRWKLTGLFDDAKRMYDSHRLVGNLPLVAYNRYSCQQLEALITTRLDRL